jgi:hypothetical protein
VWAFLLQLLTRQRLHEGDHCISCNQMLRRWSKVVKSTPPAVQHTRTLWLFQQTPQQKKLTGKRQGGKGIEYQLHGDEDEMNGHVDEKMAKNRAAYAKRLAAKAAIEGKSVPKHRKVRRPVTPQKTLNPRTDPFLFMASTPFPSLDRSTGTVERGLWCRGCAELSS